MEFNKNGKAIPADRMIISELLPNNENSKIKDKLKNIVSKKNLYLWLCFAVPAIVMYLIYLAMEIHPFGDGSVLVLDLNAQYVYFFEALREFVWGDASLLYSFSRQLGGEFMGIYAYYLSSPFSYLIALFPRSLTLEGLLIIFLLKTGLCGLTCGYYLTKITVAEKLNKINVVMFSTMYALCSYAIVQQNNTMWIDALIWLPILTYSIEQLIKYRKFKLYVIILALTVMSNYYIGYMVCIYVVLYFFTYYFAKSENAENNLIGEKLHFAKSLFRIIIYSIISMGMIALMLLAAYYSLTFGKTTFTDPSWKVEIKFDLMDYLTKFLPGSYDTVRRSGLPFVYSGVLTLFMLPAYFISNKISNREKIMSGVIITVFSVSFMISVVDLVWHGFQEPNWLNYRYSFMLSFLMLVMAYKAFNNIEEISGKVHLTTAAFIFFFLMVAQKYTFSSYNKENGAELDPFQTIGFTLICLAIYLIILGVYKKAINKKSVGLILALVVSVEMFANGLTNTVGLGKDVIYSSYSSYNDFMDKMRPIVDQVQAMDTSFYRMEKINHRRTNDNMALSIRGLSNSSSTLNKETVGLLNNFGYSSAAHKSTYYGGNILNDSLLGLRYIIADNDDMDESRNENDSIKSMLKRYYELYTYDDNYNVYYNPYALSLAYAVSSGISEFEFLNDSDKPIYHNPYDKLNAIVTSMLGSDDEIKVFVPIEDNVYTDTKNCDTGYIDKHIKYSPESKDSSAFVTYSFVADRTGDIYFYLPSSYPREVELTLNGDPYGTFYGADRSRSLLLGYFEEGEEITLKMKLKSTVLYVKDDISAFYYIDDEALKNCLNALSETQLVIDDDYSEAHITGSITTVSDSQTILTTIPYDEGWTVKVDGEKVDIYKSLDALITFDIVEAGEHSVEFIYCPDVYVYGAICSGAFILLFTALVIFEKPIYSFIYRKLYDEGEEESDEEIDEEALEIAECNEDEQKL